MDLELSDEQRLLASSVKAFVDSELMPWEAVSDRAGEVSPELGRQLEPKERTQPTCYIMPWLYK